jgi:hypothetical protein
MLIINKSDPNEIYQIYTKTYKVITDETKHNLADFYIWLVENQCVQLDFLIKNMYQYYKYENPFENDYYILDGPAFLCNKGLIGDYVDFGGNVRKGSDVENKQVLNKNTYRLEDKSRVAFRR